MISKKDVKRLLPVKDAIDLVGMAYSELSNGSANIPDRLGISGSDEKGVTLIMPGYLRLRDAMAVKMVSVFPDNVKQDLPSVYGLVVVINPQTGEPLAAIEGGYLTALRTGASCGLATDLLARKDASTVAMIGAGAQSRLILPAVCSVRGIETVRVFDVDRKNAEKLVEKMSLETEGVEFVVAEDSSDAVREADIVCTATTSKSPVFNGKELKDGAHINGIGSFTPDMREVGFEAIRRCGKIVVDSMDGATSEAGDLIQAFDEGVIAKEDIHGEIGEIVGGEKAGRETASETTFFKSVGNAALDVAVGAEIVKRAKENGVGTKVEL